MPAGGELGIKAGEYWAYRRSKNLPLVRAQIIYPGRHYDDEIRIRVVEDQTPREVFTKRAKLPCKWENLDAYLDAHPDIPRGDEVVAVEPLHVVHTTNELRAIVHEEVRSAFGLHKIAYTYAEAAVAVGLSAETLRLAVRRGELIPRYAGSKPLFPRAELERWVDDLPIEPGRR